MTDSSDKYFYNDILYSSSSDSSSYDESDVFIATLVINEHIANQQTMFRGSVPGLATALNRNREGSHVQLFKDYFHHTDQTYKDLFSSDTFV